MTEFAKMSSLQSLRTGSRESCVMTVIRRLSSLSILSITNVLIVMAITPAFWNSSTEIQALTRQESLTLSLMQGNNHKFKAPQEHNSHIYIYFSAPPNFRLLHYPTSYTQTKPIPAPLFFFFSLYYATGYLFPPSATHPSSHSLHAW